MIYIAVQLIQIFSAGPRVDHGGTRGPRGPKNMAKTEFVLNDPFSDALYARYCGRKIGKGGR